MEGLLDFFKENCVALQITIDINRKPTVHAVPKGRSFMDMESTVGETVVEALKNMKNRLFG
ncbi:hypothetical protein FKN04_13005 [Bacillus glycinifermentans]|uniref:hypothetical protein n=1 Tax=Bacillus TaxID=1386 RepID=UPI001583444C|nr:MULTISPECIES: hypothetical protein [Bacillus]NUJ17495.1 hypothetical protein [Bacillus glycinifermentans]GIN67083.1 hypothetical protein J41TS2_25040 [Bacillus sonorensis]